MSLPTAWSARCSPGGATIVRQLPVARACASATWREAAVELARVVVGADDVEREVLEHPDADAVAVRGRAVGAAEQPVVDRLGGAGEPVAVERAVDDRRDPPAGDRVLAELEQAGGHRAQDRRLERARRARRANAAAKMRARRAPRTPSSARAPGVAAARARSRSR